MTPATDPTAGPAALRAAERRRDETARAAAEARAAFDGRLQGVARLDAETEAAARACDAAGVAASLSPLGPLLADLHRAHVAWLEAQGPAWEAERDFQALRARSVDVAALRAASERAAGEYASAGMRGAGDLAALRNAGLAAKAAWERADGDARAADWQAARAQEAADAVPGQLAAVRRAETARLLRLAALASGRE